jgi:ABC-type branched-subunit amino acid transport system ATPase component
MPRDAAKSYDLRGGERQAPALQIKDVRSGYGESDVLRGVSLTVDSGAICAILGKNGMGKTTLLKTVMGFLPPKSGRIEILGQDTTGWPPYRIVRLGVSYVPQEKAIFQDLSVGDNLKLALRGAADFHGRLQAISESFPVLQERLRQRAGTLSGGEQKMLLVARALLARPRLLLIDEISEGLQPLMMRRIREVLAREGAQAGMAIVLVEQNVGFALDLAHQYVILKLGEVVESGWVSGTTREAVEQHLVI